MDDRHQDRELTDEQIATVMPGVTQVMDAREADRDGTDGDANDGTDGDANDGTDGDANDGTDGDAKDADGTDTPSTS